LKAEHSRENRWAGVDVLGKKIGNMNDLEVLEPLRVKVHAIKTATESAIMILRIDDAIFARRTKEDRPPERPESERE